MTSSEVKSLPVPTKHTPIQTQKTILKQQISACLPDSTVVPVVEYAPKSCKSDDLKLKKRFTKIRGATLNIYSMRDDFKLVDVASNARNFNQEFVLLQETRRNGFEDVTIEHKTFSGWRFIGLGFCNGARGGVGILLSPKCIVQKMNKITPGRILQIEIILSGQKIALTSAYAPDETYSEATKLSFWHSFSSAITNTTSGYKTIAGGDLNATILRQSSLCIGPAMSSSCFEHAKSTSFNGHELLAFASVHKLFLENTFFETRRACHQWTFKSNNSTKYRRRLDYILTDSYVHSHTTNCRSYDPRIKTDHRMVVLNATLPTKFQRKIVARHRKKPMNKHMRDFTILRDDLETRRSYVDALENELVDFSAEGMTADEICMKIQLATLTATEKTIPVKSKAKLKNPWITDEYLNLRTRIYKNKTKDQRKQLQKELNREKCKLIDKYSTERANKINNNYQLRKTEEFFRLSKDLEGPLKPKRPQIVCSETDFVTHFSAHFGDRSLPIPPELNHEDPFIPPRPVPLPELDNSPPRIEEIETAMSQFKNGKAKGTDGICNEQIKYAADSSSLVQLLFQLSIIIWNLPTLPISWCKATLTTLHKKGPTSIAKNFRPISMIATLSRMLTKIIVNRARSRYEALLSRDQFGFRSNSGTIDAIYCIRNLLSKKKGPVHALFLDLRGAFDLLDRRQLFRILEIQLGTGRAVDVLKAYYTNTVGMIKFGNIEFDIGSGVRQGAEESPMCFNIFFDYVLAVVEKEVVKEFGVCGVDFEYNIFSESNPRGLRASGRPAHANTKIWKLLYADDLVFLDSDRSCLFKIMPIVHRIFTQFGLIIATDKTKSMTFQARDSESVMEILKIDSVSIEQVLKFRYLGFNLSCDVKSHFLDCQISAAWTSFTQNRRTLTNRRIKLTARISLLEALVRSKLLYSVQVWMPTQEEIRRLEVVYRSFLRKMVRKGFKRFGQNLDGHNEFAFEISNEKLYKITNTPPLEDFINCQIIKYNAHVTRMENSSWQKQLLFMIPERRTTSIWTRCSNLFGGIDEKQVRRMMQDKAELSKAMDQRFGTRMTK